MPSLRRMLRDDPDSDDDGPGYVQLSLFVRPVGIVGPVGPVQQAEQDQPFQQDQQDQQSLESPQNKQHVIPGTLTGLEAPIDDLFDSLLDAPLDLAPIEPVGVSWAIPKSRSLPVLRPKNRTECQSVPRPCPFVSCRYNLYLDVRNDGVLRLNFPDREPDEMVASCSLDLASDGPRTLDAIAGLMGMSKERARQLEASGLAKVEGRFSREDVD